jgi:RHS repeat-associated protein
LTDVYEDPEVPGGPAELDYQTSYTYDVIDNLVKVTQGTQQRFFMYDSLKRLIRTRNPEQATYASLNLSDPLTGNSAWSVGYQYDANGNVTQRTDPRGVVSTYAYDALNRNITIDYSDTASINPDLKRFYDGAIKGKGRFWYNYSGGDFSTGSNVEHVSIDSYDSIGRPLVQRQLFKLDGTWSGTYQTSRTYNSGGQVTSQTYPSGHVVNYNYDAAGRMANRNASNLAFTGTLGDGVQRTYASENVYSEWGSLSIEKFGTQTPLYHKRQYNIRGQLWDVRVATGSDVNGSWNRGALQFFYEPTYTHGASGPTNNGNVLKSSHYTPDEAGAALGIPHQFYTYDSLNRLTSAAEYFISDYQPLTQTSLQSYSYDRWGNRTIDELQTWGTGVNSKKFSVDPGGTNRLTVPSGQSGVMTYDSAGNLTTDTYSGAGIRTYDAENRMITAADYMNQTSRYTYDADGHRTRRKVASSQEQWSIYGFDGELLAEYRAMTSASAPEKEYGYRNGQLLITASGRFNVALAANGAVATASSAHTCCGFSTTGAINGNNRGPWSNGEGWNDATENVVPDWIQVDFAGSKTIDEISVFSLHDNYTQENTATETQTFSLYGLVAFNVQYWNGSSWVTIPGGTVTGNNKVWRKFTFSAVTTSKIRVYINSVPDAWSRVVEIQAFGNSAGGEKVKWLVPDHLGTPRIILDDTGNLAGVRRHDYLPFGEELYAGTGGRTPAMGYVGDGVRQQFTAYERDAESGLDFAGARFYASTQGRFTSVDPLMASATPANPQTFNRYSYVTNSPLTQIDPSGMFGISPGGSQLGGIGSLGNFSLNLGGAEAEGSIGGLMSMHESLHDLALNPQDPVTGLHPDACGAMAETAQKIANIAVKNAGGDFGKALTEFDYEFGTLYAGRPLRNWDDAMVLQRGADTEAAFGLLGESGFDPKFQEGRVSNDQTHHFVTYFSGGLNAQDGILKIHRALEDQPADVRLGDAAQLFGHAVRNDPERLKMIGTSIQIRVCDDKKRPVPKFER